MEQSSLESNHIIRREKVRASEQDSSHQLAGFGNLAVTMYESRWCMQGNLKTKSQLLGYEALGMIEMMAGESF